MGEQYAMGGAALVMNRRANDITRYATREEAEEGIYIDFEGFVDHPPALIGILYPDRFVQLVLEEELRKAADAKGLKTAALSNVIGELIEHCQKSGQRIFAFTRHEMNMVRNHTGLEPLFSDFYKDGHKIARRWFNCKHRGEDIDDFSFEGFMRFIGEPVPHYYGQKKATKRLKYVTDQLSKKNDYEKLTPVAKAKWTKLLNYNKNDCEGLRKLVLKAIDEL